MCVRKMMRKSCVLLVCGFLMISGAAFGEYPSTENPTPNLERILKSGKLVVGTIDDYVPFQMRNLEGELMGYNVDLMKDMAEQLGVELVIRKPAFNMLIPSLQNGDVDMIIAGMSITPKRALAVACSIPYFYSGYCLLGNKKHECSLGGYEDFDREDLILGGMMGTPTVDYARKFFKKAEVKEYKNLGVAFMAVVSDKADAVVVDESLALYFSMLRPDKAYMVEGRFSRDGHGIFMRHGEPDLVRWVNTYLRNFVDSFQYQEAYTKWFENRDWWEKLSPELRQM